MDTYVITCEHGGNEIPPAYRQLFVGHEDLLQSHRGYDAGALTMAEELADAVNAPLVASTTSRLLIDLNRSIGHRQSLSAMTRGAPDDVRAQIIDRYYRPHRHKVEHTVKQAVAHGDRVIHIASHSFTPELDGAVRNVDVGLLYDPRRPGEVEICARWKDALAAAAPELRVRRNSPYKGTGDGLTPDLRHLFAPGQYVGIELEINQAIVAGPVERWAALRRTLIATLRGAVGVDSP